MTKELSKLWEEVPPVLKLRADYCFYIPDEVKENIAQFNGKQVVKTKHLKGKEIQYAPKELIS